MSVQRGGRVVTKEEKESTEKRQKEGEDAITHSAFVYEPSGQFKVSFEALFWVFVIVPVCDDCRRC
jgi:hypothetical protein